LQYTYDANGNILAMGAQTFTYDGVNRLVTASHPGQKTTRYPTSMMQQETG